jgi:hypothetical protein
VQFGFNRVPHRQSPGTQLAELCLVSIRNLLHHPLAQLAKATRDQELSLRKKEQADKKARHARIESTDRTELLAAAGASAGPSR